jgi:hypothetical protein
MTTILNNGNPVTTEADLNTALAATIAMVALTGRAGQRPTLPEVDLTRCRPIQCRASRSPARRRG